MKIYTVGGYVRDTFLGLEPKDCDYVVVGSSESEMLSLGYEQVGKDFPVFLHPKTRDEYALARTERKTGAGYGGFEVDVSGVTLEEDLFRRDLTMNAMAMDEDGNIIDPYNGQDDIKNKLLRHVSEHFKEDPVRILRIARFSARYDFNIAENTLSMMQEMVQNGEFDNLTSERVWKEFEKVLSEPHVKNFFTHLDTIGALQKIPGFSDIQEMDYFDYVQNNHIEKNSMLNLLHVFSSMDKKALKTWKMPSDEQQIIMQFSEYKNIDGFYAHLDVANRLNFIQKNKALHDTTKPEEIIYAVSAYQSWKNKVNFDAESHIYQLQKDVSLLKTLDYESIVQSALANKVKPNEAVRDAQTHLLQPKKGLKI